MNNAKAYLEGVADRLRAKSIQVSTCIRAAERPVSAIGAIAEELGTDVIALATHGYSGIKRAFLGSMAEEVLRRSPVPLLVQRPFSGRRSVAPYRSTRLETIRGSEPLSGQSSIAPPQPIRLKVIRRSGPFSGPSSVAP